MTPAGPHRPHCALRTALRTPKHRLGGCARSGLTESALAGRTCKIPGVPHKHHRPSNFHRAPTQACCRPAQPPPATRTHPPPLPSMAPPPHSKPENTLYASTTPHEPAHAPLQPASTASAASTASTPKTLLTPAAANAPRNSSASTSNRRPCSCSTSMSPPSAPATAPSPRSSPS